MKIDFYVLETNSSQKSRYFACQLIEQLYSEHKKDIYVHTSSREEAERFDALLWTYREDSFIPHQLYEAGKEPVCIQIGHDALPDAKDFLLNFHPEVPSFYKQFDHVIEIVFIDALAQQSARERYKQYREQGHTINTIKKYKADLS